MELYSVVALRGHFVRSLLVGAALLLVAAPLALADPPEANRVPTASADDHHFRAELVPGDAPDSFNFETERIRGTIRLDGAYHGVTQLVDKQTGKQVIDSRYSALNLFKLMSVNQIMGQPRQMERTVTAEPHWVEVKWAATETHQAEITARYEVVRPNAVDVTVTVRSEGAYRAYELFMSSYFDKVMRPHVSLWARGMKESQIVLPTVNDAFRGTLPVFPRDAHAARHCVDGRWERSEQATPTIQVCPMRYYAHYMAFMTDPENQLGVVLMSRPADCYAISTRYHAEKPADRLTSYSAFDLSLFGDDFLPGNERTVKARLAVTPLDSDLSQPLKLYQAYLAEVADDVRASNLKGTTP